MLLKLTQVMQEISLIPQKKAAFASGKNIAEVEARKDELAAASADQLTRAQARAEEIRGFSL